MKRNQSALSPFRSWYETQAEGRDTFEKFEYHLLNQLRSIDLSGKRVLEVGCGKGAVALYLALFSAAEEVVALDQSVGVGAPAGVLDVLRSAVASFGVQNLRVSETDVWRNGFADGSFDVIIANNSLHHTVASGRVSSDSESRLAYVGLLEELARLLVPRGMISMAECSRVCLWRWSPLKLRCADIDWDLHPTRREWLSVVSAAGFTVQEFRYQVPYSLRRWAYLLSNGVADFLLGLGFVVLARSDGQAPQL